MKTIRNACNWFLNYFETQWTLTAFREKNTQNIPFAISNRWLSFFRTGCNEHYMNAFLRHTTWRHKTARRTIRISTSHKLVCVRLYVWKGDRTNVFLLLFSVWFSGCKVKCSIYFLLLLLLLLFINRFYLACYLQNYEQNIMHWLIVCLSLNRQQKMFLCKDNRVLI